MRKAERSDACYALFVKQRRIFGELLRMSINDLEPPQQTIILEFGEEFTDLDLVGYVKNRGPSKWPETAALQFCYGESDGGCPAVPLASLAPGELAQVVIDLRKLSGPVDGVQHLVWCIVDSATGEVLDQNQFIEVFIKFTYSPANDEDEYTFLNDLETSSTSSSFVVPSEGSSSSSSWMVYRDLDDDWGVGCSPSDIDEG